ncbi:MAG: hypothetical protein L6Q66_11265 [Bacteroidia bacterium]|nr:hypothetical protein [Bacteroidia bacterium]
MMIGIDIMKYFFTFLFVLELFLGFSQNENAKYVEVQVAQQYKNLIEAGDKLMTETKYAQAEVKYYNALQLCPQKVYAKSQLEKAKTLREKNRQESLVIKDSIDLTFIGDSLIIPKTLIYKSYSRPDTSVLVVSKIVGESVELNEKIRFGLFHNLDNYSFAYALYLSVKGQILIEAKFINGTTQFFPYSLEKLMSDAKMIEQLELSGESPPPPETIVKVELRLRAKKIKSDKTDTFTEGHHFYYTTQKKKDGLLPTAGRVYTYEDQYMMYVKLVRVLNNGQPGIEIEKEVSGFSLTREFVPLSDIIEIAKTKNSNRFRIGEDSVLTIESY